MTMPPLIPLPPTWSQFPPIDTYTPSPRVVPPPSVSPSPRVDVPDKSMSHRTRSCQPISALSDYSRVYPSDFIDKWALSEVLHPT